MGLAGAALVVWNLTLMESAVGGRRMEAPNSFGASQAARRTTCTWLGHPFSYPANLAFAWRNGVTPAEADMFWPNRFLADPVRPYGRIDLGGDDAMLLATAGIGRSGDGTTFRWASREATVRVALDHAATLRVQVRGLAFTYPDAPPQTLTVSVNGSRPERRWRCQGPGPV